MNEKTLQKNAKNQEVKKEKLLNAKEDFLKKLKKENSEKFAQRKKIRRKKLIKTACSFTFSSILLAGTSLGGSYLAIQNFNPEKFDDKEITINELTLSKEDFCEKLTFEKGSWYIYNNKRNKKFNLSTNSNETKKAKTKQNLTDTSLVITHDTIKAKKDTLENTIYYFYNSRDSISNIPTLGSQLHSKINIRYFTTDDNIIQYKLDELNDEYNCTSTHEFRHFLNEYAGSSAAEQSYWTKFSEMCADEVSANIDQLIEQRENYFAHGKDKRYIMKRFSFYREWLEKNDPSEKITNSPEKFITFKTGEMNPVFYPKNIFTTQPSWQQNPLFGIKLQNSSDQHIQWLWKKANTPPTIAISQEEAAVIANGVFNEWMKDKYEMYIEGNVTRAKNSLINADYDGCCNHAQKHLNLMNQMFYIRGINFYQYIQGREIEFTQALPDEFNTEFARLTKTKKDKMGYLQKVTHFTDGDIAARNKYFKNLKAKHEMMKFINKKFLGR